MSDYGFLIDPENLIYKAMCTDGPWQLLGRPVTYEEFKDMAYLKDGFFTNKFGNFSQTKCFCLVENGEINYDFQTGQDLSCTVTNLCSLVRIDHTYLNRFVSINNEDDVKHIKIQFPDAGKYKVEINAKGTESGNKTAIAEYVAVSQQPCYYSEPNYLSKDLPLGLNARARDVGLSNASHKSGYISTDTGHVELKFNCNANMSDDIFAELERADKLIREMDNFLVGYHMNNQLVFRMNLPRRGYYILKLFTRKPTSVTPKKAVQKTCIGAFVINALQACTDRTPYPVRRIGHINTFFFDHIESIATDEPYLTIDGSEYTFEARAKENIKLVTHIDHITEAGTSKLDDEYTLAELSDQNYRFHVRFPQVGTYSVQIFGENETSKTGLSVNVYTYLVVVQTVDPECVPFPWQACDPINSSSLIEPRSGKLQPGVKVVFKIILGEPFLIISPHLT